jgi:hypothetical protein
MKKEKKKERKKEEADEAKFDSFYQQKNEAK